MLGVLVAATETGIGAWVELNRHGSVDRAFHAGRSVLMLRTAGLLAGPLSLTLRLLGWTILAAISFLLGTFLSRYGWLEAGRSSAADPEATFVAQESST